MSSHVPYLKSFFPAQLGILIYGNNCPQHPKNNHSKGIRIYVIPDISSTAIHCTTNYSPPTSNNCNNFHF